MNYPLKIKKQTNNFKNFSNRGMSLEEDINITNEYYIANDIAVIYKKPIPIQVSKVDYPSRNKAVIKEAFYKTPSTTDYNGLYKGKYVDFEAKETRNKTNFPKNNIHEHQLIHLKKIVDNGGIAFVIIKFTSLNEIYLIKAKTIIDGYQNIKTSFIPYTYIKDNGYLIKESYCPRLDYLKVVDKYLIGGVK